MLYAYAIDRNKSVYYLVDIDTGVLLNFHRSELLTKIRSGLVENLLVRQGKVVGKGYSVEKFCETLQNGRVYVCEKYLNHGYTEGYKVVHSNGVVRVYPAQEAQDIFKRFGVVNGYFEYRDPRLRVDTSSGEVTLKKDTYKEKDVTNKRSLVQYDREDYEKLYKKYKLYGLSQNVQMIARYEVKAFGRLDRTDYTENSLTSFIKNHKLIVSILSTGASCVSVEPVYKNLYFWKVGAGIRMRGDTHVGFLLTFSMLGKTIRWIVDKHDKKIMAGIDKDKLVKLSFNTLNNMFINTPDEWKENITDLDTLNVMELKIFYKSIGESETRLTLDNGKYKSDDLKTSLVLKDNIKINRIENMMMYNKLCS